MCLSICTHAYRYRYRYIHLSVFHFDSVLKIAVMYFNFKYILKNSKTGSTDLVHSINRKKNLPYI